MYELCSCLAVRQCVQAAVCGSAHGSVRAVRSVGYGSVRGSVQLSGSAAVARLCAAAQAAVCSSAVGSVPQCGSARVAVRQCAAVRQCVVVHGVQQCAAVRQCAW
jgi:hypothetical protein